MKKQIIIIGIAILLNVVGLSGCFNSDNSNSELNKFVGTWKHGTLQDGGNIKFLSNGKCTYYNISGKWEIKDGKLVIDLTDRDMTFDYNFLYDQNDNQILELKEVEYVGIVDIITMIPKIHKMLATRYFQMVSIFILMLLLS